MPSANFYQSDASAFIIMKWSKYRCLAGYSWPDRRPDRLAAMKEGGKERAILSNVTIMHHFFPPLLPLKAAAPTLNLE